MKFATYRDASEACKYFIPDVQLLQYEEWRKKLMTGDNKYVFYNLHSI